MSTEFIDAYPRVRFGRKLYQEVTNDVELVRVRGEWEPDEPEGWEVFTVMLHGAEAGDFVEAKIEDLRQIVAAYDRPDVTWPSVTGNEPEMTIFYGEATGN